MKVTQLQRLARLESGGNPAPSGFDLSALSDDELDEAINLPESKDHGTWVLQQHARLDVLRASI